MNLLVHVKVCITYQSKKSRSKNHLHERENVTYIITTRYRLLKSVVTFLLALYSASIVYTTFHEGTKLKYLISWKSGKSYTNNNSIVACLSVEYEVKFVLDCFPLSKTILDGH